MLVSVCIKWANDQAKTSQCARLSKANYRDESILPTLGDWRVPQSARSQFLHFVGWPHDRGACGGARVAREAGPHDRKPRLVFLG